MSAVGAGAVLDAIARMRRAERQMARTRVSRRDVRLCHSRHSDIPDRLPYPCYFLCGSCGWLEDGPGVDPMRADTDVVHEPGPCPACQAKGWVDLRKQSIAQTYREAEALDGTLLADRARRHGLWWGALLSVAILGRVVVEQPELPDVVGLRVLIGLVLITWVVTGMTIAALLRRAQPGRARRRRWRRPRPRPELETAVSSSVRGVVEGEAALQTPLGSETCVAWAVQVWSDDQLLLDEQHQAPLSVDGVRVPADSVQLDLATRRQLHPRGNDEAFGRFMARRGLSPHDSSLRIYESHLVSGVPVTLRRGGSREHGGLVLAA